MLRQLKKIIPAPVFKTFQPLYHFMLAYVGALVYGFPSRKMCVIGVTGTKGKSTTTELIATILERAGHTVAVSNTIRFSVAGNSTPNLYKMSMPGRLFMQQFLARARAAHCTHVVMEITSEGARQYRHRGIALDMLVFTNLSPEHIESHGSFEKYRDAKRSIGRALAQSSKKETWIVANKDDVESTFYLSLPASHALAFSLTDAEPYSLDEHTVSFTFNKERIVAPLTGLFNVYNALAAVTATSALGVSTDIIRDALAGVAQIKGRVERIVARGDAGTRQQIEVVVDYAHTADSLEKLYTAFADKRKICVLGNTGGGRDTWKRKEMGAIADAYCDAIILTDEDPYDDDPRKIVEDMTEGITRVPYQIIMDRREAIATAIKEANAGDVVLITGKGTDPYIMRAQGVKEPWSDADVAREELERALS